MANKYSPSDDTLNGMIDEIHQAVNKEYFSEKAKTQADKEHKEAKQLQVFLQNIKNYYSNIQSKIIGVEGVHKIKEQIGKYEIFY